MKLLTKILSVILLGALSLYFSGCKAMADPHGTDLPWNQSQDWEYNSNIPGSMLPQ